MADVGNNTSNEQVTRAIKGLSKGIDRQLGRYEQKQARTISSKQRTRIQSILSHMEHCLVHLVGQQVSLQAGLDCLEQELWPAVLKCLRQETSSTDKTTVLLQHVFQQLLRLHDGLVFCISGECRHPADIKRSCSFKSQLGSIQNERSDGYTRLYSSTLTYSGTSWDEFMDERVGLLERLWQQVRPFLPHNDKMRWWEPLTETTGLEALLGQIENTQTQVQGRFSALIKTFSSQLELQLQQQHGPKPVSILSLADKMEKWHVKTATGVIKLERYASDFQVQDAAGVLPLGLCTSQQWKPAMMNLPQLQKVKPQATKKRRRIIHDSDDEDEDGGGVGTIVEEDSTTVSSNATGLKVSVQHNTHPNPKTTPTTSVRDIKQQLGVNVENLTTAREGLEAEEAVATQEAALIDQVPVDDLELFELQQVEDRVKRLRHVLKKVTARSVTDPNEIWDARECTRQAAMDAGNRLLWSSSSNDKDETTRLGKAIQYFVFSKSLVKSQQKLHEQMTMDNNTQLSQDAARFYGRNLILLEGRASANIGIAKVELVTHFDERDPKRKIELREATRELEKALESAESMLSMAQEDATKGGCDPVETLIDLFQAHQLKSLSQRWLGIALWQQGRRKEATKRFENAGCFPSQVHASAKSVARTEDIVEAEQELRIECYYSWATLAELASRTLERTTFRALREFPEVLNGILDSTMDALQKAADASKLICSSSDATSNRESFCNEKGILSHEELTSTARDLGEWWNSKKESSRTIESSTSTQLSTLLPRNDLNVDSSCFGQTAPTRRLILTETNRRRKKTNLKTGAGYSNIGLSAQDPVPNAPVEQRKFRKWGDELLPQTIDESGRSIPKLCYPSIAPEMPPELKSLVEQWRRN